MRLAVILALIVSVVLVQALGLESTREIQVESRYAKFAKPAATSLLPIYLSSLFMGPLRAILVNGLWIAYENASKERKFHLMKELTDFITILQPRNEGIWSMIADDFFIQIAPDEHDKLVRYKKWERYGLEKLFKAFETNPESPVLSWNMGILLMRKGLPSDNAIKIPYEQVFNWDYIKYFMEDTDLQKRIQGDEYTHNKNPFELSALWFEKSTKQIKKMAEKWVANQFHVVISPHSNDQWVRVQYYKLAMYLWYKGEIRESKEWLKKASVKAVYIANTYGLEHLLDVAKMYDSISEIVGLEQSSPPKFLQEAEKIIDKYDTKDDGFVWQVVSIIKSKMSGDPREYNDTLFYNSILIPRSETRAVIGPEANDIDYYYIYSFHEKDKLRPFTILIENGGKGLLTATILFNEKRIAQKKISSENREMFEMSPSEHGTFHLKIESTDKNVPYSLMLTAK